MRSYTVAVVIAFSLSLGCAATRKAQVPDKPTLHVGESQPFDMDIHLTGARVPVTNVRIEGVTIVEHNFDICTSRPWARFSTIDEIGRITVGRDPITFRQCRRRNYECRGATFQLVSENLAICPPPRP